MQIGRYHIVAELGSGGMGTVYRADGPDGPVALKVIHPHLVGRKGFRARFEREVEAGRRIRHENVVRTLEAGAAEVDGKPTLYLAMELVEGQTLRALLEELGRVPEDLCLHIGREVGRSLDAIHAAGVFHRDVKPENVLITPASRVKLMDLGVALVADESLRLSQSGVFVGSVLYAAPERFAELPPDGRADLYTLGLVLYELATGQHPFQSDDMATVIQRQMSARPRPPAELSPQLSPFFEELILNLLHKDREERIATAAEVVRILEEKEESAWWHGRARELRAEAAAPLRRIRIPRETSLQGRDAELAELDRLFREASAGEGRVLLVEGEAGIGKTRLVDEFAERQVRKDTAFHLLVGSYPPGGAATAAGAFSTAYREFFGSDGLEERLEACLAGAPGLVPGFAALLRGVPPPAGVAPLTRDAVLHAFTLVTCALAAERPAVIVIEDLHFAPELGRAIFASLAASLAGERALLVGTMRPGPPADWVTEIERLPQASRLLLRRLTPKELAALLSELFRSEKLASELGWAIATKSDGNPFFVFELVRALREENLIVRHADGTWIRTGLIRDIQVPSSVLDLVEARIRDLDEIDKDLLELASCCGFEFDPLLVAAALGLDQIPAMKRFAHLEKKHRLVRAAGRRYVFDHHQVQEALYRGLPDLLREPYHEKLGRALEARHAAADRDPAQLDGAVAVDLCRHFLSGAEGQRARRYLSVALDHLRDGYLHDQAIELLARALAAEGLLEGPERVEMLLRAATSLEMRGRHREDREVLEEALALADALAIPALQAKVRVHLGRLSIWTSDAGRAQAWLREARDLARKAGDAQLEVAAGGNLGIVLYRARHLESAEALFADCLGTAKAHGDRRGMAVATLNLGNVCWCRGEFDAARAHYERYRELSRTIGYREGEALAAGNLGNVLLSLGRLAEARAHYEEVLKIAAEIGDRHKIAVFETSMGHVDLVSGRPRRARERFERSLALSREIGMPREEARAVFGLAHVAREEGDPERARALFREALELFGRVEESEGRANARVALALLERDHGDDPVAARELDEAIEATRTARTRGEEVVALAARACLPGGDITVAEQALSEMRARLSVAQRMLAAHLLHEATGDPERGAEARTLVEQLRDHAPAEDRTTLLESYSLHRAILSA